MASPLSFGQELKRHRLAAGLTMQQLARQISYSESMISRWESGERPPPGEEVVSKIESALGMELGRLARFLPLPETASRTSLRAHSISAVTSLPWAEFAAAITTGLADSPIRIWQTWLPSLQPLLSALIFRNTQQELKMRILTLDPASQESVQRALDLGLRPTYGQSLHAIAQEELRMLGSAAAIQWRYFSGLPSMQLYMCERLAFASWFSRSGFSTHRPQVRLSPGNPLFQAIRQDYDSSWEKAKDA